MRYSTKLISALFLILLITLCSNGECLHWKEGAEGLLGCYGWNRESEIARFVRYSNWSDSARKYTYVCYEGSVGSVLLYNQWPKRSMMRGTIGDRMRYINHNWAWSELRGNCSDSLCTNILANCSGNYCTYQDEVARVFAAVEIARTYYVPESQDGAQNPGGHFAHILKNRFGYCNARQIRNDDPGALDSIKYQLYTKNQPVFQETGHSNVIDGYRFNSEKNCHEIHLLDLFTLWTEFVPFGSNLVIGLDPGMNINPGETRTINFYYGNAYLPNSDGIYLKGSLHIEADPRNEAWGVIAVTVRKKRFRDGQWENEKTLIRSQQILLSSQGDNTPEFSIEVPQEDSCILSVELSPITNRDCWIRMIIEETDQFEQLLITQDDSTMMTFKENGSGVSSGQFESVTPGLEHGPNRGGLCFINTDHSDTVATIRTDGVFLSSRFEGYTGQSAMEDPVNRNHGLNMYYNDDIKASVRVDRCIAARRALTDTPLPRPLYITSLPTEVMAGTMLDICWDMADESSVASVRRLYQIRADAPWQEMDRIPIRADARCKKWLVPLELTNESLVIRIEDSQNPAVFDVSERHIAILPNDPRFTEPQPGNTVFTGETVALSWEFPEESCVILQYYTTDDPDDFVNISPLTECEGFMEWDITSTLIGKTIYLSATDYADANIYAECGPLYVR